jgi:hypothetical protein
MRSVLSPQAGLSWKCKDDDDDENKQTNKQTNKHPANKKTIYCL